MHADDLPMGYIIKTAADFYTDTVRHTAINWTMYISLCRPVTQTLSSYSLGLIDSNNWQMVFCHYILCAYIEKKNMD